jgi:transposase
MQDDTRRFESVDWATDAHAAAVVDRGGDALDEFEINHSSAVLAEMCRQLVKHSTTRVAIERPDGPVVGALLEAASEVVVVVSSRSIKALRERYGTSGNKSDRSDAYVLANCLRTHGHRWRSLEPDSPATVTLRSLMRARKDLVETRVAAANQLPTHLEGVSPDTAGLLRDLESPICLRFVKPFPSETRAEFLSERRLASLVAYRYCARKPAGVLFGHLRAVAGGTAGD